jgi:hypothetical protein
VQAGDTCSISPIAGDHGASFPVSSSMPSKRCTSTVSRHGRAAALGKRSMCEEPRDRQDAGRLPFDAWVAHWSRKSQENVGIEEKLCDRAVRPASILVRAVFVRRGLEFSHSDASGLILPDIAARPKDVPMSADCPLQASALRSAAA